MVSRSLVAVAMLVPAAAGTVMLTASSCSRTNNVSLAFWELPVGDASVPHGFLCKVGGRPLAAVALENAADAGRPTNTAYLVTDLITWDGGGYPGCRAAQLIDFCRTHDCSASRRSWITAAVPEAGTVPERVTLAMQSVDGGPAKQWDTPDQPLIVRVFATFQPGTDLSTNAENGQPIEEALDPSLLFGCAYSCPVRLDDVRGELLLDLDTLDPNCAANVRICASDRFADDTPDAGADEPVE